ncbi:uncharacterized protein LOC121941524 [Plectropomus leopardus]|uniref:uncharacterized protein LOC121941524 n=1 Tax=Plectropomus leopardus TaxID=160734 RepID=UPI001C4BE39E|nr:uncharacterized protein LOC121941524 [Plectropomus leopardus]
MNKLADRTQERLYGKKHEDTRTDSRGEQQRGTPRHYSNSSSSSSSFSSRSRSFSSSPSRSCSRDSRRRRERSCSRDRRKDELTQQDGNQYSEDAQSYRDKDKNVSTEISSYQHPYPQNQTYPPPHPAAFPTYPDYTLPHGSQYVAYHSDTYSHATNSYLPHSQAAIPPSNYSSRYAYPENAYNQFPVQSHAIYPGTEDINLLLNPDLSTSEGQTGSYSGPRCLQVISTKQQRAGSCLKRLTKGHKRRGNPETCWKRQKARFLRKKEERKQQKIAERMARQSALSVQMVEAPQPNNDESNSKAEQSEEEKRPPTEEEVKANLRKKLEAFNQKVKQRVSQPAPSITSGDLW